MTKTAYELRISDWSSDVCSSDLAFGAIGRVHGRDVIGQPLGRRAEPVQRLVEASPFGPQIELGMTIAVIAGESGRILAVQLSNLAFRDLKDRSEEHTSELQSLMRISYAVFCLKKKQLSIADDACVQSNDHGAVGGTLWSVLD